jgi:hypothetical protein
MTKRYPNGTWCGGLLPVALLLMPYALVRYAIDQRRARKCGGCGGGRPVALGLCADCRTGAR